MPKGYKEAYYQFMVKCLGTIIDYNKEKGFVLGICRGIAYVSNDAQIKFSEQST